MCIYSCNNSTSIVLVHTICSIQYVFMHSMQFVFMLRITYYISVVCVFLSVFRISHYQTYPNIAEVYSMHTM